MPLESQIVTLVRTLRSAGLPLGVGAQVTALRSAAAAGIERRADLYWALHAALVSSPEQSLLFQQAFALLFAREPQPPGAQVLPWRNVGAEREPPPAGARRLHDAVAPGETSGDTERELYLQESASRQERLQHLDFEQMSLEEVAQAKALLRDATLIFKQALTRRYRSGRGRGRRGLPRNPALEPAHRRRAHSPGLIASAGAGHRRWCSCATFPGPWAATRACFCTSPHAVTNARDRVHTLVFGTRLTNISRSLQRRDVDAALDRVSAEVVDWHGGTRIGESLKGVQSTLVAAPARSGGYGHSAQ